MVLKTLWHHGTLPNELAVFTNHTHLSTEWTRRACLAWWLSLAVVLSVPPTGQIAMPTLAVGLDGILRQAVSWKLKLLREAGLGWWDNWYSAEWEEEEKQLTSCWGKCL